MVFRRRDRRSFGRMVLEFFWPRGGWGRAAQYVKHRVRRLPDTPEKISRGIWAGVFTTFTPFFGLHFIVAGLIAMVMRGNILAALLATFFGNPLTYVPIAATSLWFGRKLTGVDASDVNLREEIGLAWADIWHNLIAIFSPETMRWHGLIEFYETVFYPFMVGSIVPGVIAGTIAYYLSVPLIRAYQNRRRKKLKEKLSRLQSAADDGKGPR